MDYLVTMTTHVPDGTLGQAVAGIRARQAARSRELAAQGNLLRPWRLPAGAPSALGRWRARHAAEMQAILEPLPLAAWMTVPPVVVHGHEAPVARPETAALPEATSSGAVSS